MILNKYELIEKIGVGSFGSIYKGKNIRTNEDVAVKVESIKNKTKLLKNETKIYQYLTNIDFVPTIKWFGKDELNYYMVLNLLGASLEQLRNKKGLLNLRLTLQIGIQIIIMLEEIHNQCLIHRDIKPDNFLLGLGDKNKQLYIIDFGFCKSYMKNGKHIPLEYTSNLIGTPKYASINAHQCLELSRRDDLESLGYMLLYLHTNKLEWNPDLLVKKDDYIYLKEMLTKDETIPKILIDFLIIVRNLEFDEMPKYSKLSEMFEKEIHSI